MKSRYEPLKVYPEEWVENKETFIDFFHLLSDEDKKVLLVNAEFRDFLIEQVETDKFSTFLFVLKNDELTLLFDQEFITLVNPYLNSNIFKGIYQKLTSKTINTFIDFDDSFIDVVEMEHCLEKLNNENRKKALDMVLKLEPLEIDILCSVFDKFYPISYTSEFEDDYSLNDEMIKWISLKLEDEKISRLFFDNKSLMLALDTDNRCELYSRVKFKDLKHEHLAILESLLSNAERYLFKLPDSFLFDEEFVQYIASKKDWSLYKKMLVAVNGMNPLAGKHIRDVRNVKIDLYIEEFMASDFDDLAWSDNYAVFANDFKDVIFQRYFKSYASDVYLTACTLLDSINTLPGFKEKLSEEGVELIERLVVSLIQETKEVEGFDFKNFGEINEFNFNNLKSLIQILQTRDDWGDMFNKALKVARKEFSKSLATQIYSPVQVGDQNGNVEIIDITNNENFKLLIHVQCVYLPHLQGLFEPISHTDEKNISMSLLDNNHLTAFEDDQKGQAENRVLFGYSNVQAESIQHALPYDAYTDYCGHSDKARKKSLIESVTRYLPSYIDINSFMVETGKFYNEIKIQAHANALNEEELPIFMPSYILCRDEVRELDKEAASKLGLPIVFVDTKEVVKYPEQEHYQPIIRQLFGDYTQVGLTDKEILK